jgi:hypothetical protein
MPFATPQIAKLGEIAIRTVAGYAEDDSASPHPHPHRADSLPMPCR